MVLDEGQHPVHDLLEAQIRSVDDDRPFGDRERRNEPGRVEAITSGEIGDHGLWIDAVLKGPSSSADLRAGVEVNLYLSSREHDRPDVPPLDDSFVSVSDDPIPLPFHQKPGKRPR